MIHAIELGEISNHYINKYNDNMRFLSHLNKVNIFIGENNSGKSRLLRHIIKENDVLVFYDIKKDETKKHFDNSKNFLKDSIAKFNGDKEEIIIPKRINELNDSDYYCDVSELISSLHIDNSALNFNKKSILNSIQAYLTNMHEYLTRKDKSIQYNKMKDLDITYIPVLRGIEGFDNYYELQHNEILDSISMTEKQHKAIEEYKENSKHVYVNKVSKAYTIDSKKIFTAEDLFDDVKNKLLGVESERNFISDFEKFISKEFYDNKGFNIIPQINKGYLNVKIAGGKERAIHDLGDGIKQLITIFYKIFEKRNKEAIFFIEEPEINLHPGYQRQFLEIIQTNPMFSKHQFFITTHSNHFIDNCLDYSNTSIYKFENVGDNDTFKVVNTTNNDIEILNSLGVNNTSVFVSNCTIWVEGISDKILISKYLEIYMKDRRTYKEDINYSFIEYGGNNIEHWSFENEDAIEKINASGITNRCFIVCDNDGGGKQARKEKLRTVFGEERFYELNVREIENTISRQVLEKTLFDNQEVIYKKKYEGEQYANSKTYMGDFIDNHYVLSRKYSIKNNVKTTGSGTIRDKLSFAKKVASNINSVGDLSKEGLKLAEMIYNFIKTSNIK